MFELRNINTERYSNWPIVVFALIGNFSTTLCFAILYMYTGQYQAAAGPAGVVQVDKKAGSRFDFEENRIQIRL